MEYKRENDFIDYMPIRKTDDDGTFPQEVHFVFYDKIDRWIYEVIDNENWILSMINGQGHVYRTEYNSSYDVNDVCERLSEQYPDAEFIPYDSYEEWMESFLSGWEEALKFEREYVEGSGDFCV